MDDKAVLEVRDLCKRYPNFYLDNVSFSLMPGTITGFIGRNGAGKTTTLSCLMDLVHPDSGSILFFGRSYASDPAGIRQDVGFASGGTSFYPHKRLEKLSHVTGMFYRNWDHDTYMSLLERFSLDPGKTPDELSSGMKVKYSIVTALSHKATLLILDEPTSGLDPASRADLLEVFLDLVEKDGVTILFSTQITSDLEDYADRIIYIQTGKVTADSSLTDYLARYRLVVFPQQPPAQPDILGMRRTRSGWTALMRSDAKFPPGGVVKEANLSDIMILLHR